MTKNFFITGLPRSRTAWLAAYFSALPGVHCYHEGLKGCHSKAAFFSKMIGTHPVIGNSDSGIPLTNVLDNPAYKDAPVVKIWRSMAEVTISLEKIIPVADRAFSYEVLVEMEDAMQSMLGLDIDYEDVDERLPQICEHLELAYDEHLHETLKFLNIQTMDLEPDIKALEVWTAPQ